MTALDSRLVELVAKAISPWYAEQKLEGPDWPLHIRWNSLRPEVKEAYREQARAALAACHAEELVTALRELLDDSQHRNHDTSINISHQATTTTAPSSAVSPCRTPADRP